MYTNISDEFKQIVSSNAVTAVAKIVFTSPNITISGKATGSVKSSIQDVQITDNCYDNGKLIGTTMTKEVEIKVINKDDLDLADKEFELFVGVKLDDGGYEYIPYGKYIVTIYEDTKSNNIFKIIAYDYMFKLNKQFKDIEFKPTFPITLKEFRQQLLTACEIEYEEQELANDNFVVDEMPVFDGMSVRNVLGKIAELQGTFAKVNRNNKIQFYLKTTKTKDISGHNIVMKDFAETYDTKLTVPANTYQETREGYNLLNFSTESFMHSGLTFTKQKDNSYIINGTSTDVVSFSISNSMNDKLNIEDYTYADFCSGTASASFTRIIYGYNDSAVSLKSISARTSVYATFRPTTEYSVYYLWMYIASGTKFTNFVFKPMLVKGKYNTSTLPPYEQYGACPTPMYPSKVETVNGNMEILVNTENLLDITEETHLVRCASNGKANTEDYRVIATGADAYINEVCEKGTAHSFNNGNKIPCKYGEKIYYTSGYSKFSKSYITEYNKENISLGYYALSSYKGSYTVKNEECEYITYRFGNENSKTNVSYPLEPMIYKTLRYTYVPHEGAAYNIPLKDMGLCKIKEHEDYLYKYNNKWYKHTEIGRYVFTGEEPWQHIYEGDMFKWNITDAMKRSPCYCNMYPDYGLESNDVFRQQDYAIGFLFSSNTELYIRDISRNGDTTSLKNFMQQQYESGNPVVIYYVLGEPTDTEILDEDLIEGLNKTQTFRLYEGTNFIDVIGNEAGIAKISLPDLSDMRIDKMSMNSKLEINKRFGPVNSVALALRNVEGENVTRRNEISIEQYGETMITITDNPFVYTEALRETAIPELFDALEGFLYYPTKFNYKARLYTDCGDAIEVENVQTNQFMSSMILNQHIKIPATRQSTLENLALSDTAIQNQYISNSKQDNTHTEISVNKINKKIESIVKSQDETGAEINQMKQTQSETISTIQKIGTDAENTITELNELKQTIEGLSSTVEKTGGNNLIYYDSEFWTGQSRLLPNEYEKLKYIETTGTQYIDTGYFATENTRIKAKLLSRDAGNKNWFGGSVIGTQAEADGFVFNSMSNNSVEFVFGNSGWNAVTTKNVVNYPFTIDFSRTGIIVNDELIATPNFDTFSEQTGSLRIFARYSGAANISGRCYNFSIYENGVLVRDYIPCLRKGDEVPGLYDIINGEFYSNAGFGNFGYDYELPEEYQEIEYLESSGSQYINTGHIFTGKTTFDLDIMETQHGNSEWCMFIGVRAANAGQAGQLLMNCNSSGYIGGDYNNVGSAFQGSASNMKNNLTYIKTKIERSDYNVYIDNTLYATTPYQEFTSGINGTLFAFNAAGQIQTREAGFRIYACKIYEDGVIVRNFVPCYNKENNIAGFYDMANSVFYENAGTGTFIRGNEVLEEESSYTSNKIEEYTDTEIQNNSVSGLGYILNNGHFEQTVQVVNGIYTVSFDYKKIKELATGIVTINGKTYELTEMDWTKFSETLEVNSNYITIKFDCNTTKSFFIVDTLINLGDIADVWTQNPNETRTDTVKIGKGIQITSSVKDTKLKADADGVRIVKASDEKETVTEFTDKGTKTEHLETPEAEVAGILFQEVTYNGSKQTWISSLL